MIELPATLEIPKYGSTFADNAWKIDLCHIDYIQSWLWCLWQDIEIMSTEQGAELNKFVEDNAQKLQNVNATIMIIGTEY